MTLAILLVALLLVAWMLWPSGSDAPEPTRIAVVGQDLLALALDKQVQPKSDGERTRYWELYDNRDAPEGAFMGWMLPGADSLPARVPLRRTIEPGKYYVFVKGVNYGRPVKVKFSLGGGEATVTTDDQDDNGDWTDHVPITVDSATDALTLTLQRSGQTGDKEKLLLRGLYLTTEPGEIVLQSDRVVTLDYPTRMDESDPRPGNLIENGSFEVGLGHGWGSGDDRRFSMDSLWDPKAGKDGRASLKLPLDPGQSGTGSIAGKRVMLVSKPYSVTANKRHTLSVWLKSEPGADVTGQIALVNSFGPPAAPELEGKRGQHIVKRDFRIGGDWTRIDVSGFLLRYPTADYHVRIIADVAAARHLWIDAVSLSEGASADYAPKAPLEIGLQRTRPSNLFYDDERVRMPLRVYNSGRGDQKRTVRYEIYDYLNRRVGGGRRTVSAPAGRAKTVDLRLDGGRRGIFRVVMWVEGEDGTQEEVIYGILPRPRRAGPDRSSLIGTHSNFTDFQYEALSRLGIKWDRAMSPGQFFRWGEVEPQDDKFIWFDAETKRAPTHGISTLGTLGTDKYWPKWAEDDGLPDLEKWQEFVRQTVSHYRGQVVAWEVWNEPNHEFEPAFYARMLKRAAEAIKEADPAASVVAMGGPFEAEFVRSVFDELQKQFPDWPWRQYIDQISIHMYPSREDDRTASDGGPGRAFREQILPAYKLPVWNTESGAWDLGFYRTSNAVRTPWGRSLFGFAETGQYTTSSPDAIQRLATSFLETIGNGLSKFFYYDFRVAATPIYAQTTPTMLEYDDTVRPKGIALAVLAQLFDHSKGLGRIRLGDPQSQAFLFDRGGVPLVGLYSLDDRLRSIRPASISTPIRVYDSMGNRISTPEGRIPYGPTPVYIEARGVELSALRQAFAQGIVARRADTVAPATTIDHGPRGPVETSSLTLRWSASDQEAVADAAHPNAISYSYRLVGSGADTWSAWTTSSTADYRDLPEGRYRFEVRARDAAGNRSSAVSRAFVVR